MAKLISKLDATRIFSYQEKWLLENGLNSIVSYYEKMLVLSFDSQSGDVADQIYKILIEIEKFKDIKLQIASCYFIEIDKSLLKEVFEAVEKIDVNSLEEGKSY